MDDIRFMTVGDVEELHALVMAASQQPPAALVRREALESAVNSCKHLAWYQSASVAEIAAHLSTHIALAHPWVDGNKRSAATSGIMFARYNGARQPSSEEALQYAKALLAFVEADHDARPEKEERLVAVVEGWFN